MQEKPPEVSLQNKTHQYSVAGTGLGKTENKSSGNRDSLPNIYRLSNSLIHNK